MLADVPDNAMSVRQVVRVAHEHGRIFIGWNVEINETGRVRQGDQDQKRTGQPIDVASN